MIKLSNVAGMRKIDDRTFLSAFLDEDNLNWNSGETGCRGELLR